MNNQEYDQKKRECWEEFIDEAQSKVLSRYEIFSAAFDRAYALGKQEKDAEGEEMLTAPRSKVQEIYCDNCVEIHRECVSSSDKDCYQTVNEVLKTLFGSKCLPDEEPTLKITAAEDCVRMAKEGMGIVESKPAEPKFKVGDKVRYVGDMQPTYKGKAFVIDGEVFFNNHYNEWQTRSIKSFAWDGLSVCNVPLTDLEPYTKKKYHKGEKVRYNGYVYEIEGLVGKNRYALKGLNFDLDEDMIEPYTEPEKEYRNLSLSEQQEAAWNNIPSKLKEKIESKYAEYNVEAFNGFAVGYCAAIRDIFGHDRFEVVK